MNDRQPMDLGAYEERARRGPCFVCAFLDGNPDYKHLVVFEDADHVAFLDRWPTLPGKVLVAPKRHIEHAVSGFTDDEYVSIMLVVRKVALAVEKVFAPERTYLLSLGAQDGNAHVHWHIAGLPHGVPYEEQQFHALMSENGVLDVSPTEAESIAAHLRAALS
ncbi:HIT family protein [Streptomyces hydrogenans]|uniref:HIT family protein n=1 Tax=Streptomyces hydrogenans TaxID=1873719 RepID=UPI0038189C28